MRRLHGEVNFNLKLGLPLSVAKQDDFIRTALRVPPDLHAQIHAAANAAGRTFNAEIVHRLTESFDRATIGAPPPSKGRVATLMDIYGRDMRALQTAKQELADARAKHNELMAELLHGEEARSRSVLREAMAAENERIRKLEREIARLEGELT